MSIRNILYCELFPFPLLNVRNQDRTRRRKKRDRCPEYVDGISSPHLTALNWHQRVSCRTTRRSHPTVYVSRFLYRGVALIRSTWMRADLTELYASVTVVVTMGYRGESRVSIPPSSPRLASWLSHDVLVIRSSLSYTPYQYQCHTPRYMCRTIYTIYPVLYPTLPHYAVRHTPLSASLPSHRQCRTRTHTIRTVIPANFLTNCFFRRRSVE